MIEHDPRDTRTFKFANKQIHAYAVPTEQVFVNGLTQKLRAEDVSFSEVKADSIDIADFIALTSSSESAQQNGAYGDDRVLIIRDAGNASPELRDQMVKLVNASVFTPGAPHRPGTAGNFLILGKDCEVFVASRPSDGLQDTLFYSILEVLDSNS